MYFLKRLWNGDVPLVITYWVFNFIPGIAAIVLFTLVEQHFERVGYASFSYNIALLILVIILLLLTYNVFIWIALWRSSDKYSGPKVWPFLVKVIIILGVTRTGLEISNNSKDMFSLLEYVTRADTHKDARTIDIKSEVEANKKLLPIKVDEYTNWIDVFLESKTITYKYNINLSDAQMSNLLFNYGAGIKENVLKSVCDLDFYKKAFNKGYNFKYSYYKANNEAVLHFYVKNDDCNQGLRAVQNLDKNNDAKF